MRNVYKQSAAEMRRRIRSLIGEGYDAGLIFTYHGYCVRLLKEAGKHIFLPENFQILSVSRQKDRIPKELTAQKQPGASVVHFHAKNDYEEADYISEQIKKNKKEGVAYADCAVLYRAGYLSRVIENSLLEHGIPYDVLNGVKFYDHMEIQDVIAYLNLICFDDDKAFLRIVYKPRRRFGRKRMDHLLSMRCDGEIGILPHDMISTMPYLPWSKGDVKSMVNVDDRISHMIFGEGSVTEVAFDGSYKVQFGRMDTERWLSPAYVSSLKQRADGVLESPLPAPAFKEHSQNMLLRNPVPAFLPSNDLPVQRADDIEAGISEKESPLLFDKIYGEPIFPLMEPDQADDKSMEPDMVFDEVDTLNVDCFENNELLSEQIDVEESVITDPDEYYGRNFWKRSDVPHSGWLCVNIVDLGALVGRCGMCGERLIRYAHIMTHPMWKGTLQAGCVCAGRMCGDEEGEKRREHDFKQALGKRLRFTKRKMKTSRCGNSYIELNKHIVVLLAPKWDEHWRVSVDRLICKEKFASAENALAYAYDYVMKND